MKNLVRKLVWPGYLIAMLFFLFAGGKAFFEARAILSDHAVVDAPLVFLDSSSRTKRGHTTTTYRFKYSYEVGGNSIPQVFLPVDVAMAKVGEKTGSLHSALARLASWKERDHELRQRLHSALSYPLIVVLATMLLTAGLIYGVIPQFLDIFLELGAALPLPTRILLWVSKVVSNPGAWILALAIGGFAWMSLRDLQKTRRGGLALFRFLRSVPIVGPLLTSICMTRYASAASVLLGSGIPLTEVLQLSAVASGSNELRHDASAMVRAVEEGETLSEHMLARADLYPALLTQMVVAGEESAQLEVMFQRVARFAETEANHKLDTLTAAMEPILLGLVSVIVGSILVAVLLPLYGFLNHLA